MFFDPFRRYDRITFVLEQNQTQNQTPNQPIVSIETTVGQLNFFRWALENNVIDYIKVHIGEIEDCMASFQKSVKASGSDDKKTRRTSNAARAPPVQTHTVTHTHHSIRFD